MFSECEPREIKKGRGGERRGEAAYSYELLLSGSKMQSIVEASKDAHTSCQCKYNETSRKSGQRICLPLSHALIRYSVILYRFSIICGLP